MQNLRIAAAQSASVPGDIAANVERHLAMARAAADASVSFLLFPELSLSGYEPDHMVDCMLAPDDARIAPFRALARQAQMTIVLGAPVAPEAEGKPAIGAINCLPDGTATVYRKRFLHAGEEAFASAGTTDVHLLDAGGTPLSLAICADTVNPQHAQWAHEAGAQIYAAGVVWSGKGYVLDARLMQHYAATHGLATLVANHAAPTGGYVSAGGSAFWKPGGELMGAAPEQGQALLIAERQSGEWSCRCERMEAQR